MYTIGQFSRICRTTTKTLRHYEKLGIISPARVEPYNQYRYYTEEQAALMRNILQLRDLGVPLKDIKRILERSPGLEEMREFLREHRQSLLEQINLYNSRLVRLAWWEKALEGNEMTEKRPYQVQLKELPEIQVRSERRVVTNIGQELPAMLVRVLEEIGAKQGTCSGPPICLFYDEEFKPEKVDVGAAWPVADPSLANQVLPSIQAASVMHVGPYDRLEPAYQALFAWINQNGYQALVPMREVNYNDPRETPPEQLVTEIIIPIRKA